MRGVIVKPCRKGAGPEFSNVTGNLTRRGKKLSKYLNFSLVPHEVFMHQDVSIPSIKVVGEEGIGPLSSS